MANKTYNQYCAIAQTLDVVGERWTLLVVRNLVLGPKRFSDLMRGLPGISTNILTERLKVLEENGVVMTRFLPPPAASTVYDLTERGYALVDALSALARWGSDTLGKPESDQLIVPEAIGFMVMGVFYRKHQVLQPLTCLLHIRDHGYEHQFGVRLSTQGVSLDDTLSDPDTTLQMGLAALSALSSGRTGLQNLLDANEAQVEGTQEAIQSLLNCIDTR